LTAAHADRVVFGLGAEKGLDIVEYRLDPAAEVSEEVRRPDAMQLPSLALQDRRSEDLPLHRIGRLLEAIGIAENPDGHIVDAAGMLKRQIDTETVVAPVHIGAGLMS